MNIVTAVTNDYDTLKLQPYPCIALTDRWMDAADCWEQRLISKLPLNPRLRAKLPKLLMHDYVEGDTWWIDASIVITGELPEIDADIAIFPHRVRDCIYQEAEECKKRDFDEPIKFEMQTSRYKQEQYPEHNGLHEACVIWRRDTPEVRRFNEIWWQETFYGSNRDQISLEFAAKFAGVTIANLPGTIGDNPWFQKYQRPK